MTIEQLKSGSYRIRQMYQGKLYSLTVKELPSNKDAQRMIDEKIQKASAYDRYSFKVAADKYVSAKSNVLSPSTIRGYKSIIRNIPDDFKRMHIGDIDTFALQKLINRYSSDHSAKSTHNLSGFVCSVLGMFRPNAKFQLTLPQKPHKTNYTPSHDDVVRLLNESKDTEFYAALYLAALSCRVSEICAVTMDDLNGDELTINKALVRAEKGFILKETPKTDASNRTITLPHELVEWIQNKGYIYRLYPLQIDKYLRRTLPKLGIPFFSPHKLRHFFASYSHDLGYSDAMIQGLGGWSTDLVMKRIYRHSMNEKEAKQSIKADFTF